MKLAMLGPVGLAVILHLGEEETSVAKMGLVET